MALKKNPPTVGQAINPSHIKPHDYIDGSSAVRVYATELIPANSIVYVTGVQKNRMAVALAKADNANTVKGALFISPFEIAANTVGFVVTRGQLFGVVTTGSSVGAPIILSKDGAPITAGGITTEEFVYPIGTVIAVADGTTNDPTVWVDLQNAAPVPYFFRQALRSGPTDTPMVGLAPADVTISVEYEGTDISIVMPYAGRILDAWIWKNGAAGPGAAVSVEDNASQTALAIDLTGALDGQIVRAQTVGINNTDFAAGHTLKVNVGGTTPNGTLQLRVRYSPY